MKVRCNNCMSIFDEEYICDISEDESCPVCGRIGVLMDVPQEEFPQYYNHAPVRALNDKSVIQIDGIEINKNTHTLKIRGKSVNIPPQELSLLIFLVSNCNQSFTRQELFEQVWGFNYIGDSRTIDVHIRRLRERLNGVSNKWSLKTIWGTGYKFEILNEQTK